LALSRLAWRFLALTLLLALIVPGAAGQAEDAVPADPAAVTDEAMAQTMDAGESEAVAEPTVETPVVPVAPYRSASPEYGMNVFIWDQPRTTNRDLGKVAGAGFTWQKTLFQWKFIEPVKGQPQWAESERVVKASNAQGIKVLARLDFQPNWARADGAFNGPPDDYQDYANFVFALVNHFKPGAGNGVIDAIELWNEPNLSREWGNAPIGPESAADYVRLMCMGHEAAKRASPHVVTISAGLSPTGTLNSEAADDTVFLQWMYDAGAQNCFDVLGAHGAGYKAPPWIGPDELASDTQWGGHPSFGFRRVEMLRDVMVQNADEAKQVWLLEFGWTSDSVHDAYAWHRVTEEQKGTYIVEAYRWAALNWAPWIGVMTLWNVAAPDWTTAREEYWWSITAPDGSNRPAYDALMRARRDGQLISVAS
jgi:polysaccharide biosynthesis protein PslG